ncbi:helix-turn-helix transcriptional regulator [Rahnella inusitata]|jgi:AraC-like DNA-binding protein|uniref:Helix-turn-helix domain-containing protein n=1 Tax=Rahnella inusitata TaxID=58169 RepID=A0ABX9P5K8_9GAMM|nr:helix-turn-helix domain-containing protein [Rahnella inusitata]NMC26163.1 helix-turn-helix transcriptional regulator [Serratia sp. (in: enterobacteria)]QUT13341.1 helix-turn-helix transcriptional regulator [Rahnella inusitata]RJT16298.1 helix-turn-helix domain-containing protein [Rahnella inusitata]
MVRKIKVTPGIGSTSLLIQHSELFIQDVYIDKPQLLLIQNGSMTVHYQHQEVSLQTGEMLVLNSGQTLGLTHQLSENGPFSCAIMAWDNALLTDAGLHTPAFKPPLITVDHLQVIPHVPGAFRQSFIDTHNAILWHHGLPAPITRHRMLEQLLWLSQLGVRYSLQHSESMTQRVRELLVNNLHKAFTAAEVAEQLMMNEVMLRRRLAAENSVLRNLMIDVRMTHALRLLQCTDLAISHIAHQVGYESGSRFAERFRKRFGFAPTAIRGHLRAQSVHSPITSDVQ